MSNVQLNITLPENIPTWKIESLIPYDNNPRTHSEEQINQLVASMVEFGFTNPILVDRDTREIIAGHGRLMAARKLGLREVPVIALSHLNEAKRRKLIIADNQLALNAGWDMELLATEISALNEMGEDLDVLGFDSDFLDDILKTDLEETPQNHDQEISSLVERFGVPPFSILEVRKGYPWAKVYDSATGNTIEEPLSARIAGLIAKTDNDKGFWWSPSNNIINGIIGISKPIDFTLGDPNCVANYLNENLITTVIQQDGFRLWGNRTTSADSKWAFLSVRRTADMINDSLLKAHLWAIDRNITKTYVSDVCDGVSNYLRYLKNIGAIINGSCWADSSLNTPDQISQGKIVFDFDFTPPYPAEHITFRSRLTDEYLTEIFE